eukprot:COSAG04_NODE_56_length_30604_cov_692.571119_25_plen_176_part_00
MSLASSALDHGSRFTFMSSCARDKNGRVSRRTRRAVSRNGWVGGVPWRSIARGTACRFGQGPAARHGAEQDQDQPRPRGKQAEHAERRRLAKNGRRGAAKTLGHEQPVDCGAEAAGRTAAATRGVWSARSPGSRARFGQCVSDARWRRWPRTWSRGSSRRPSRPRPPRGATRRAR